MEIIKDIEVKNLGLALEKIGDFLYYEGPLLSLFKDKQNLDNYYFYKWSDNSDRCNRWLVFNVSTETLRAFLYKEISLKGIILKNPFVFFVDIDNDLIPVRFSIAANTDIPSNYMPASNSFYDEDIHTELSQNLKKTIIHNNIYDLLSDLRMEIENIKSEQKREIMLIDRLLADSSQKLNPTTENIVQENAYPNTSSVAEPSADYSDTKKKK